MKFIVNFYLIAFFVLSKAFCEDKKTEKTELPQVLTTLSGKTYNSPRVVEVAANHESIRISHDDGICTLKISDLPTDVSTKIVFPKSNFDYSKTEWNFKTLKGIDTLEYLNQMAVDSEPRNLVKETLEEYAKKSGKSLTYFIMPTDIRWGNDEEVTACSEINGDLGEQNKFQLDSYCQSSDTTAKMLITVKSQVCELMTTRPLPAELFFKSTEFGAPRLHVFLRTKIEKAEVESAKSSLSLVCGVNFPKPRCKVLEERHQTKFVATGKINFVGLVRYDESKSKGQLLASWTADD